ncbi:MAG: RagB/SusD family nutrient uptake outer membrane protein [Microscillaceae bacterium]|nr:RagB/SusD family nutrient uptake outer membrane protein [Microscillaceae bacterium]
MKLTKKIFLTVFVLMIFAVSCKDSFLEIPPVGQLSDAQLTSETGLQAVLLSAYAQLNGRFNRLASPTNWVWGSIRGGDANKGTDPGDFSDINPIQEYEYLSTQGVIRDNWNGNYEGIARANLVLRLLNNAAPEVTDATKALIAAEARFLRAHYYFQLKRNFNNTPYVDENVDYGTGIELVGNSEDLWPKIEADFQFAVDNLPDTQGSVGKANVWAAKAYLAKVYLYQAKYAQAKTLFDDVIANGKTSNGKAYDLVPEYAGVFRASNDNNEESVFAIQAAANTGSVNNANPEFDLNYPYNTGPEGPGNCCGFFQPSFELANSFRTDANGLPILTKTGTVRDYNIGANQVVTDFGLQSNQAFTPDAGNLDPRIDHSIGRRGIPYLDWKDFPGRDWIRNQENGGPYAPKKFIYYKSDVGSLQDNSSWTPGYTALNFTIIRFADVLLMAAEVEVELGNLEAARALVNRVRERAANPSGFVTKGGNPAANYVIDTYDTAWTDAAVAREAVRMERKLELSGEGHRFYDLCRWGVVTEEVQAYLAYEKQFLGTTFSAAKWDAGKDELLPLPQDQIDLYAEGILTQNPGF